MSNEDAKRAVLIRAQPAALFKSGATALAARGRDLLRKKEEAAEWLRKGLELRDTAPADPRVTGPINPYAPGPQKTDLRVQLQTAVNYLTQVLAGSAPDAVAASLGMTRDDLEVAHVAHFFVPETLAAVMGNSAARIGERVEDHAGSTVPVIPSPAGMGDGVLSQKTVELSVQISLELERIEQQVGKREENLEEAFRCFETGHELDSWNPELLYWLAESYRRGDGVFQNEEKALALFRRAADMGYASAQTAVGDAYAQCGFSCIPEDFKEAARWYQAAAEQGDEEALCMIVDMYQRGKGVKQNHSEAARLLRDAAARGNENAKHNLRLSSERYGPPYDRCDGEGGRSGLRSDAEALG